MSDDSIAASIVGRDDGEELVHRVLSDPDAQDAIDDMEARRALIDYLTDERAERGWTQTQLARRIGTTQSAVSDFEKGAVEPRLPTLQRWARAFGFRLELQLWKGPLVDFNSWEHRAVPYDDIVRNVKYSDDLPDWMESVDPGLLKELQRQRRRHSDHKPVRINTNRSPHSSERSNFSSQLVTALDTADQ